MSDRDVSSMSVNQVYWPKFVIFYNCIELHIIYLYKGDLDFFHPGKWSLAHVFLVFHVSSTSTSCFKVKPVIKVGTAHQSQLTKIRWQTVSSRLLRKASLVLDSSTSNLLPLATIRITLQLRKVWWLACLYLETYWSIAYLTAAATRYIFIRLKQHEQGLAVLISTLDCPLNLPRLQIRAQAWHQVKEQYQTRLSGRKPIVSR